MCYYYQLAHTAAEIEKRFKAKFLQRQKYISKHQINGFQFTENPVIINQHPKVISFFKWGLIPFWAKDDSIKKFTLNAKIETLKKKPSFRHVVDNRCLIPADGFYEWKWLDSKGKHKQKYKISIPGNQLFSFGGLWSEWVSKQTGEIIHSYTIVTIPANSFMAEIHNSKKRMPLILTENNEKQWFEGLSLDSFYTFNNVLVAEKL